MVHGTQASSGSGMSNFVLRDDSPCTVPDLHTEGVNDYQALREIFVAQRSARCVTPLPMVYTRPSDVSDRIRGLVY